MKITRLVRSRATKAVAAAAVGLVMLTGCNGSFAGAGQMPSANLASRVKATLGFSVLCNVSTQTVSGTLTYIDSAAKTSINAKATNSLTGEGSCDNDQLYGHYRGTYTGTVNGVRSSGEFAMALANGYCGPGLAAIVIQIGGVSGESINAEPYYYNEGCMTTGYVTSLSPRSSTVLR